jgi:hypothetical protein
MEMKDVTIKGMELTACIIKLLTKALSDKSLSNTTTSSLSASHATNFTDIDSTITSGSRSNMLSMTTAELYDICNNMSFLDSTNRTTTSEHVISAILKEYEDAVYQEQNASNTHIQAINQSHMQNIPEAIACGPILCNATSNSNGFDTS